MGHGCVCVGWQPTERRSYKDKEAEPATKSLVDLKGTERPEDMAEPKRTTDSYSYRSRWQADEDYIEHTSPSSSHSHGIPTVLLHQPEESPHLRLQPVVRLDSLPSTPRPAHVLRKVSYQSHRTESILGADSSRADSEKGFYYGHGACEAKGEF